jgi:hypothetical protein
MQRQSAGDGGDGGDLNPPMIGRQLHRVATQ